jgi:hypothetical protein
MGIDLLWDLMDVKESVPRADIGPTSCEVIEK